MSRQIFTPLLSFALVFSLTACDKQDAPSTEVSKTPVAANTIALLKKHSCVSCHKMEGKQVGPGYKEIALKYKGDATAEDKLIAKIATGGAGVWGTMPMPPMSKVNQEDIKLMVTYILSLAK
jgi:cytochrome c